MPGGLALLGLVGIGFWYFFGRHADAASSETPRLPGPPEPDNAPAVPIARPPAQQDPTPPLSPPLKKEVAKVVREKVEAGDLPPLSIPLLIPSAPKPNPASIPVILQPGQSVPLEGRPPYEYLDATRSPAPSGKVVPLAQVKTQAQAYDYALAGFQAVCKAAAKPGAFQEIFAYAAKAYETAIQEIGRGKGDMKRYVALLVTANATNDRAIADERKHGR